MNQNTQRRCRDCGEMVTWRPGKPGYVDQCEECANDVDLLGGNMIYSHKTAPELEIKPLGEAKRFNKITKRLGGVGVTGSITQSREEKLKDVSQWVSKLGEKRRMK